MTSVRPVWQGAVNNCAMALGTNALVSFGIQMVLGDGSMVSPSNVDTTKHLTDSTTNGIYLVRAVHVASRQSKVEEVNATNCKDDISVVTQLSLWLIFYAILKRFYDFRVGLNCNLNNWDMESLILFY